MPDSVISYYNHQNTKWGLYGMTPVICGLKSIIEDEHEINKLLSS
jgi:hypothetical protein